VVGSPRVQGTLRGIPHVDRRVEVGLADLQVDDPLALALERPRPRQHLEGRLGAQAPPPFRDVDHDTSFSATITLRVILPWAGVPSQGGGLSGRVKVNVEPLPTALSTHIFPPCSSTNFFVSVSPSPVPSCFLADSEPTWRNSSNTAA